MHNSVHGVFKRLGLGNASWHKHHPHIPMSAKVFRVWRGTSLGGRLAAEKSERPVAMVMAVAVAAAVAVVAVLAEILTLYNP